MKDEKVKLEDVAKKATEQVGGKTGESVVKEYVPKSTWENVNNLFNRKYRGGK